MYRIPLDPSFKHSTVNVIVGLMVYLKCTVSCFKASNIKKKKKDERCKYKCLHVWRLATDKPAQSWCQDSFFLLVWSLFVP